MKSDHERIRDIQHIVDAASHSRQAVLNVMIRLHENLSDSNWVGVYVLRGDSLLLGPYVGPKTDHVRIPVGEGVCGTAVAENKNQIVGDVQALDNYLACNLETRSEIVVLIRDPATNGILGQIDVDGTRINAFGPRDEWFLSQVAEILAPHIPGCLEATDA